MEKGFTLLREAVIDEIFDSFPKKQNHQCRNQQRH